MAERIERCVYLWLFAISSSGRNAVHRIYLHRLLPMAVGNNVVFGECLRHPDGFRGALEEIHDWRATQLESVRVNNLHDGRQFVAQLGVAEKKQDFERGTQLGQSQRIQ